MLIAKWFGLVMHCVEKAAFYYNVLRYYQFPCLWVKPDADTKFYEC